MTVLPPFISYFLYAISIMCFIPYSVFRVSAFRLSRVS